MSVAIIQQRLESYQCRTVQAEEQALREITQEVTLAALSRTDFYNRVAFHGGTCLRVLYHLNRFSEDLDFMLDHPNPGFSLDEYLRTVALELEAYGYRLEVVDRSKADSAVKKAFLKDDSLGKVLQLTHLKADRSTRMIRLKVEVDTNPPVGSQFENKFLDFPFVFSVRLQGLSSLFAGKIHALLCREFTKGRDWYDFIWYTGRGVGINLPFLAAACRQVGPWQGQDIKIDQAWCLEELQKKITALDWETARADIKRFIAPEELSTLEHWGQELFLGQLAKYRERQGK